MQLAVNVTPHGIPVFELLIGLAPLAVAGSAVMAAGLGLTNHWRWTRRPN
ncbi:hypothetical protein [Kitasatospora sp. SUK 42]|nr:hypothetical protein [Kitasatospora sp. SUK 42]MBV2156501.1 hypothetical protein [Kitasatospora sp. SUK 42]